MAAYLKNDDTSFAYEKLKLLLEIVSSINKSKIYYDKFQIISLPLTRPVFNSRFKYLQTESLDCFVDDRRGIEILHMNQIEYEREGLKQSIIDYFYDIYIK